MRQNCTTSKFSPSKFFQKTLQILNDKTFFDLSMNFKKPALQKTRDPGIRDPSSIDISRKIFEISRKIFEIWQYNITNKKTAYYFFEPLVQPFEHFKHCNTDIITLYTHAY